MLYRLEIPRLRWNEPAKEEQLVWIINDGEFRICFNSRYHFDVLSALAQRTAEEKETPLSELDKLCIQCPAKDAHGLKDLKSIKNFWTYIGRNHEGRYFKVKDGAGRELDRERHELLAALFPVWTKRSSTKNWLFRVGVAADGIIFTERKNESATEAYRCAVIQSYLEEFYAWLASERCEWFVAPNIKRHYPQPIRSSAPHGEPESSGDGGKPLPLFETIELASTITILLGNRGFGKSTCAQELAALTITSIEQAESGWILPVLIDLTDEKKDVGRLANEALIGIKQKLDSTAWQELGRLYVVLDGLDRLDPSISVDAYLKSIRRFASEKWVSRIVVTCQKTKWHDWCWEPRFGDVFELLPFDTDAGGATSQYIQRRLPDNEHAVQQYFKKSSALSGMVAIPQMLSYICDLLDYGVSTDKLQGRIAETLRKWIETRIEQNGDSRWHAVGELLLGRIAEQMVSRQSHALRRMDFPKEDVSPHAWTETVEGASRSGLLQVAGPHGQHQATTFAHETIRNYYAGIWVCSELRSSNDCWLLMQRLGATVKWDEPFLLALGLLADRVFAISVIKRILSFDLNLAAEAIGRLSPFSGEEASQLVDALSSLSSGAHDSFRIVMCYCAIDHEAAVIPVREILHENEDGYYLLVDIAERSPDRFCQILFGTLIDNSSGDLRNNALNTMMIFCPEIRPRELFVNIESPNRELQRNAITGLGKLATTEAVQTLKMLAKSEFKAIWPASPSTCSISYLAQIDTEEAANALAEILESEDINPFDRWNAANTLALQDPEYFFETRVLSIAHFFVCHNPDLKDEIYSDCQRILEGVKEFRTGKPVSEKARKILRPILEQAGSEKPYADRLKVEPNVDPCLWFHYYRTKVGTEDDRREQWLRWKEEYESLTDEEDHVYRSELLEVMILTCPEESAQYLAPMISTGSPHTRDVLWDLCDSLDQLPEAWSEYARSGFERCEPKNIWRWTSALSKMRKSKGHDLWLVRVCSTIDDEKLVKLLKEMNSWFESAAKEIVIVRFQAMKKGETKLDMALSLFQLGVKEGIRELVDAYALPCHKLLPDWLLAEGMPESMQNVVRGFKTLELYSVDEGSDSRTRAWACLLAAILDVFQVGSEAYDKLLSEISETEPLKVKRKCFYELRDLSGRREMRLVL